MLELSERSDDEELQVKDRTPKPKADNSFDSADIAASVDSKEPELIHDISAIRKSR